MENRRDLHVPTATIIKLTCTALLIAILIRLAPLLALMLISLILAVSVEPLLKKLERKIPRWVSISSIGIAVLAAILLIGFEVLPPLVDQVSVVLSRAPAYLQKHLNEFTYGPAIYKEIENHFTSGASENAGMWFSNILSAGNLVLEGMTSVLLVYVLFLYFLVDGTRAYYWLVAFFKPQTQAKIAETADGVSNIVSAYILGQVITSVLATIYVYFALHLLHVPAALMLAVLAGVFDALPVLGFFLSLIPAIIFALTVSPHTAFIVAGLYVLYHALENYLICPWVYGKRLRMSGLVVLVSFLAAGILAGLPGALVILPIVASYPIIEKIWLKKYVESSALRDHADET